MGDLGQILIQSYSRTLRLALWRLKSYFIPSLPNPLYKCSSLLLYFQGNLYYLRKVMTYRRGHSNMSPSWILWMILALFVLLTNFVGKTDSCGPGRGAGRRRAPRKLTPLVYKQHVPNVPENSLSASGLSEGIIRRDESQRFKELVPNYNPDILFRDAEGTGADRLMTHKLREKLNTLAISVMNQWPGVKLKVIEGWDEGGFHAPNSLHYEGRAVDIQTSDKDYAKYGMLARLAVEAGFDWVYYESRAHIHCSVKSDAFHGGRPGGCFSSNSIVRTLHGPIPMSKLEVGDKILSLDSSGIPIYSPVLLFLDRNESEVREFYKIITKNTTLHLTPSHLIYKLPFTLPSTKILFPYFKNMISSHELSNSEILNEAQITFSRNIEIGDWIIVLEPNGGKMRQERVLNITNHLKRGVYAPLTATGNLFVNDILSSCYAVIESQSLAHWSFLPIRLIYNMIQGIQNFWNYLKFLMTFSTMSNGNQKVQILVNTLKSQSHPGQTRSTHHQNDGVFWYASFLYSLTNQILPRYLLYQS